MQNKASFFNHLFFVGLILCTGWSCNAQEAKGKGYENLDTLYADFVRYLKEGGDALKTYCFRITPDEQTVAYMERNQVSYRGIPDELKKQNLPVSVIGDNYYKYVAKFRERLDDNKQLDSLVYLGREVPGEELYNEKLKVYATETFILMRSGTDTIRCKLGEMFNFGNQWKSFTNPKLGW